MQAWILALMLMLVPRAPYADTFPATAAAIDKVAHEAALYSGEDGPERTAAQLVALFAHESSFDPLAVHADTGGDSIGLGQVNVSNLRRLGLTRAALFDPLTNARAALRLLSESIAACAWRPSWARLSLYVSGSCNRGGEASRKRVTLATELLRAHPTRWLEREGAWSF